MLTRKNTDKNHVVTGPQQWIVKVLSEMHKTGLWDPAFKMPEGKKTRQPKTL